jgi:hypothetical protein
MKTNSPKRKPYAGERDIGMSNADENESLG